MILRGPTRVAGRGKGPLVRHIDGVTVMRINLMVSL